MLVIFDCDGVLVDSENLAAQVFSEELQKNAIFMSPEECLATFKGHTLAACQALLIEKSYSVPSTFLDSLARATEEKFASELTMVDGIESVLQDLTVKKIPFCVASNGGYKKIQHSLTHTGLWSYFEQSCFSAESVAKGKPSPELFLFAAQQMGYTPEEVVIVEDSETGLAAGASAGMRVLYYQSGFGGAIPSQPFPPAKVQCFSHMSQLGELLGFI